MRETKALLGAIPAKKRAKEGAKAATTATKSIYKPSAEKSANNDSTAKTSKRSSTGAQRATSTEVQEFELLEKYFDTRNQREPTTAKGLKSKAWNALAEALNIKHGRTLDKEQYKSKFGRLMHEYDLNKYIKSLSGGGVQSDIPTLDDDMWERLIESKPQGRAKIEEIRKAGFVRATICCLIAGDTRATGEQANTVPQLLEEIDENEIRNAPAVNEDVAGDSSPNDDSDSAPANTTAGTSKGSRAAPKPPNHQRRIDQVKRIRGGTLKSSRSKKKAKTGDSLETKLESVLRLMKVYAKLKEEDKLAARRSAGKKNGNLNQRDGT